jgi:predicted Zn-dependent protease
LVRTTQRGILVTNFWYIRSVNPTDLTLTGMTRDGTFLVENGEIVSAVRNFRFHESPLRAFNQLDAFTTPTEAVTSETGKVLVPAMRIRDFNFSSVTRF